MADRYDINIGGATVRKSRANSLHFVRFVVSDIINARTYFIELALR